LAAKICLREIYKFPSVTASGIPAGSFDTTAHLQFESIERFSGDVHRVRDELETAAAGHTVYLVVETDAEAERLAEVFGETQLMATGRLRFVLGRLAGGFRAVRDQVVLISAAELFQRQVANVTKAGRSTVFCSFAKAILWSTSRTASAVIVV